MLKGILKPGERLVERDLAAQLGISKTALREGNHEELLDAIQTGDQARIRSSLEDHIQNSWYPEGH